MPKKDIIGEKFGKLTVLKDTGKRHANQKVIWLCECECGNIKEIGTRYLTRKDQGERSCGCLNKTQLRGATLLRKKQHLKIHKYDDNGNVLEKQCCRCKRWLKPNEFHGQKKAISGLNSRCKRCDYVKQTVTKTSCPKEIAELVYERKLCCEVCSSYDKLTVDHCHTTKTYRGVLCHSCNASLGLMNEDPNRMIKLAEYAKTKCRKVNKMNQEQILDMLETMDSQVLNGGFYQYFFNVIEHEGEEILPVLVKTIAAGSDAGYSYYPELLKIVREYRDHVEYYQDLPKTYDQEELEEREEVFCEKIEALDDRYYRINEKISEKFVDVSKLVA